MADQVLVRVVRNLEDAHEGDEAWVEETERVAGMVAGGYFEVVDRRTPVDVVQVGAKRAGRGADQA